MMKKKQTKSAPCCPPAEPMPPVPKNIDKANAQLAALAKAIAHPARVAILRMLVRHEGCIVGDIVDAIDCMPLAIELAASRTRVLSTEDLRARLERPLDVLRARNAGARHGSVEQAVQDSVALLTEGHRRLFAICLLYSFDASDYLPRVDFVGSLPLNK